MLIVFAKKIPTAFAVLSYNSLNNLKAKIMIYFMRIPFRLFFQIINLHSFCNRFL
jgi:hypothetical protein